MAHTFAELVVGGVLLPPFVTYLVAALVLIVVLRPLLHVVGFAKMFSHASVAELSLYVIIRAYWCCCSRGVGHGCGRAALCHRRINNMTPSSVIYPERSPLARNEKKQMNKIQLSVMNEILTAINEKIDPNIKIEVDNAKAPAIVTYCSR